MSGGPTRLTNRRINSWLFRYPMPLLALGLVLVAVQQFPSAFRAHEGAGVRGTFTVTQVSCLRDCQYAGRFVSDDGHVTVDPVDISNLQSYSFGESVRALDDGGYVYPADGGVDWLLWIALFIGGVALLGEWGGVMASPERRRRWTGVDPTTDPDRTLAPG